MSYLQRCALALSCLIVLCRPDFAQAQEARLSVRTLAVEGCEMPEWYLAADGDAYTNLTWPVDQPAAAQLAPVGRELQLFSKETDAQGAVQYKPARKLTIPEGVCEVLLVAWPVEGDEKIGLMVVADGFKQAKANDWLIINTCSQPVTLRYGTDGDPIRVEPTEAKPYTLHAQSDKGSAVIAQAMVKEEMKTIYSTYWAAPEKQRTLALFYEKEGRVRLRRIIDPLVDAVPQQ